MNYNLFQMINDLAGRFDWIDDVMEILAKDIVWVMLAVLVMLWFTGKTANQKVVFYACMTASISLLLAAFVISPEVNHPRPFVGHSVHQLIPHAPDASFPSDHATLAFSLAFAIVWVKRRTGMAMLALAVLTGLARVYVGVHYPGDIAGSIVLSLFVSFLVRVTRHRTDPLALFFIGIYQKLRGRLSI
jgi:undecaprenyl-diphosphatase